MPDFRKRKQTVNTNSNQKTNKQFMNWHHISRYNVNNGSITLLVVRKLSNTGKTQSDVTELTASRFPVAPK
jgi:hypothetical protein